MTTRNRALSGTLELTGLVTLAHWARKRGLAYANAQRLVKSGRVPGARVVLGMWLVPHDAPIPAKRKPGPKVVMP